MTRAGSGRRRGRWPAFVTLSAALLLLSVAGCAARKPVFVDFSETPRDYRAKDYTDVYQRWTRYSVVRHDVADIALEAWVTFKSWDYREAYVEFYTGIYNLSETDKSALRTAQLETSAEAFEFHITAQSTNYKWNDLEKRSSAWRVTLVDGLGHELAPEWVHLEKLPDPYEIEFFPAKGPFTRSYVVRFLKPVAGEAKDGVKPSEFVGAQTGSLMLRIASPVGRLELVWQAI
jgi:hypothetical protein